MRYRLTCLTPMLVGDGEKLSAIDYMVWKDHVNVLDQWRIFRLLAKGPRRIQMNIMRSLTPDQLVDALVDGLKENNSEAELAAVKSQTAEMVATMKAFSEVKEKDVVTLDFVDGTTKIGLNGTAKVSIPGEAFNRALTKIWLGDHPIQADLKKAMLGG